mmetsp:Transcript_366/g.746  ORF Transcript_366/g.746 Transcript_366/m.746 type:complete len:231 (-) Transcript_366:586-1278(-)
MQSLEKVSFHKPHGADLDSDTSLHSSTSDNMSSWNSGLDYACDEGTSRNVLYMDQRHIKDTKGYYVDEDKMFRTTQQKQQQRQHSLLMSEFAYEIYAVLVVFVLVRRYWILHGITIVIVAHIGDILFSWFLHVKGAREIREFKSWLVWWIRIGLNFATSTVEGRVVHRVLVANTLHFWNLIGKNYTINWFDDIANKGRALHMNHAKDELNKSFENYKQNARENFAKLKHG